MKPMSTIHFASPQAKASVPSEMVAPRRFNTTAEAAKAKRQRRPNTDQRNTLKIGRISNVVPSTAW